MVFLGGPRQVGKTSLAFQLLKDGNEKHPGYLNWDSKNDRKKILNEQLPASEPLIVLDEIHKYKQWRNLVKGLYDKNKSDRQFLITGSARLDYYRRGGDSLQGRYHYHRLHPISLLEANNNPTQSDVAHLLRFGGFPEPFLKGELEHWQRWQNERQKRVIYEDLLSLEKVQELSQLDLLISLLPDRVGSPLSVENLRGDLEVSHQSVERWIKIFENLYQCFRLAPYGAPKVRAVKKEQKLYLWDWSLCEDPGARFENLVASNLLKYCHQAEDTKGEKLELRYLRDRDKREIDFVVLKKQTPLFAVECKVSEKQISDHVKYFSERTSIPIFYQVHLETADYEQKEWKTRVLPMTRFCKEVLKV